jgi:hypothetical protein
VKVRYSLVYKYCIYITSGLRCNGLHSIICVRVLILGAYRNEISAVDYVICNYFPMRIKFPNYGVHSEYDVKWKLGFIQDTPVDSLSKRLFLEQAR